MNEDQWSFLQSCRSCMQRTDLKPIFDPRTNPNLVHIIKYCVGIEILYNDGLPNHICSVCEKKFEIAFEILTQTRKTDEMLRNILTSRQNSSPYIAKPSQVEANPENVSNDALSDPSDDDNNDNDFQDEDSDESDEATSHTDPPKPGSKAKTKSEGSTGENEKPKIKYQKRMPEIVNHQSLICHICGRVFDKPHALKTHLLSLHSEVLHDCNICGKGYKTSNNLKRHVKKVHQKFRYKCDQCSKDFYTPMSLKKHVHSDHAGSQSSSSAINVVKNPNMSYY